MALSKERVGEIALILLQHKMEKNGDITLNPSEIKREILNESKKFGVEPHEAAEFLQIVVKTAYEKTMATLEEVKSKKGDKK